MRSQFEAVATAAVADIGTDRLRALAADIAAGLPAHLLRPDGAPTPVAEAADRLLAAMAADAVPARDAAGYLRGVADGYDHRVARVQTELAWTGPVARDVPVRATAQVLTDLIGEARRELILTTYSARPQPALLAGLHAALDRGAQVWIIVETLQGAGSALQGEQPASAFADLQGAQLWTWDLSRRPPGAKMHAKLAVADERLLFISSANLTTSGIDANMEAGVLIRGGTAARRTAEHLRVLRRDRILVRL
jgi:phosphatidylserine/phosphatidylglycerophosphate/cardiolipin synthase-like enzyme